MTEKILIALSSVVSGMFLKHLWDRFKNRIAKLEYEVFHNYLGATESNPYFGTVQILYNDNPVTNLFMSKVVIENTNQKDLGEFELNIGANVDSLIIVSHGNKAGSVKPLEFTEKYMQLLADNSPNLLLSRDYLIPCLNRGEKVEISMLITNTKGLRPFVTVSCEVAGVKLKESKYHPKIFGEPQRASSILGCLLVVIAAFPMAKYIENNYLAVYFAAIAGLFAIFIGVGLRKASRFLINLLS